MSGQNGKNTALGIGENIEGLLCYAFVWVSGIIFLLIEKENKFVRFHAVQSIITFAILSIIGFLPFIGGLLTIIVAPISFILWVFLMYKAYSGEMFKIPVIGEFAEKLSSK